MIMFTKKIVDNMLCPICQREKYVIHGLWSCSVATDVWAKDARALSWKVRSVSCYYEKD